MDIAELYEFILESNLDLKLVGSLELSDADDIKWFYDGLTDIPEDMETHLNDIYDTDLETLNDFLIDEKINEDFYTVTPEISESYISFSIVEK